MPRRPAPAEERFFSGLVEAGECWLWKPETPGIYGYFRRDKVEGQVKGDRVGIHIFGWEFFNGPVPNGLTVDHLCGNTRCGNFQHLDVVPLRVNVLRSNGPGAVNARKTHCKNGHLLGGDNLVIRDGKRQCRICVTERAKAWRHSNSERANEIARNYKARKRESTKAEPNEQGVQGGCKR